MANNGRKASTAVGQSYDDHQITVMIKITNHLLLLFSVSLLDVNAAAITVTLSSIRVVIKSRGPGIFPGYYESGPRLLLLENRRKIEPKEIPSRLIPRLLVLFTQKLEILVTTLSIMLSMVRFSSKRPAIL